jgi:hypothetical protein
MKRTMGDEITTTWEPTTIEDLTAEMTDTLSQWDDAVASAWRQISIVPEKWACSPMGDMGGGFWAVGIRGNTVIWYNDIEGGFNEGPFTTHGRIDEYRCEQSPFNDVIWRLPEAQVASGYAAEAPANTLPDGLRGPGAITRRTTTFWDVRLGDDRCWRIHFTDKMVAVSADGGFSTIELAKEHGILLNQREARAMLYVASTSVAADAIFLDLDREIRRLTDGYQGIGAFLRPSGLAEALARGFGILMTAPASFVAAAAAVLGRHGVEHSVNAAPTNSLRPPVVCMGLLLGPDAFIIASAFRFEAR